MRRIIGYIFMGLAAGVLAIVQRTVERSYSLGHWEFAPFDVAYPWYAMIWIVWTGLIAGAIGIPIILRLYGIWRWPTLIATVFAGGTLLWVGFAHSSIFLVGRDPHHAMRAMYAQPYWVATVWTTILAAVVGLVLYEAFFGRPPGESSARRHWAPLFESARRIVAWRPGRRGDHDPLMAVTN